MWDKYSLLTDGPYSATELRNSATLQVALLVRHAMSHLRLCRQSQSCRQMVKCGSAGMRDCSLGLVGLGIRLELVLGIGLVLGLAMVLGLAHSFPFCDTSSPQNPASPHARILPIAKVARQSRQV